MNEQEKRQRLTYELVEALQRLAQEEGIITTMEISIDRCAFDYGLARSGHMYRGVTGPERATVRIEFDPERVAAWLIQKGFEFNASKFAGAAYDISIDPQPLILQVEDAWDDEDEDEDDQPTSPGILRLPPEREE